MTQQRINNVIYDNENVILIVDDEPDILLLLQHLLSALGYKALTATDGKQAISLYLQHKSQIKLVILDYLMPSMCGEEVLKTLRQHSNECPVYVSSGLITDAIAQKLNHHGVTGFLHKPFGCDELKRLLKQYIPDANSASSSAAAARASEHVT